LEVVSKNWGNLVPTEKELYEFLVKQHGGDEKVILEYVLDQLRDLVCASATVNDLISHFKKNEVADSFKKAPLFKVILKLEGDASFVRRNTAAKKREEEDLDDEDDDLYDDEFDEDDYDDWEDEEDEDDDPPPRRRGRQGWIVGKKWYPKPHTLIGKVYDLLVEDPDRTIESIATQLYGVHHSGYCQRVNSHIYILTQREWVRKDKDGSFTILKRKVEKRGRPKKPRGSKTLSLLPSKNQITDK
jgi:hypothetical protein